MILSVLAGCGPTVGQGTLAAQQTRLPVPTPSLSAECPKPPPVMAGDDLRRALDGALIWGTCSAAKVRAWQMFYAGLRG